MPRGSWTAKLNVEVQRCQALNTANCRKCGALYKLGPMNAPGEKRIQQRIWFGERQWERIKGRAKVTPGIGSAAEFVRLACEEVLGIPSHRLSSSD